MSESQWMRAFLAEACPVIGSYGGRDLFLRGAAGRLERALAAACTDHDVKEYPQAGHSFLNDHPDPSSTTIPTSCSRS